MSVSTSIPQTARLGRSTRLVVVAAVAAVIAVAAWAIATYAVGADQPGLRTTARRPKRRRYLASLHNSGSTCSASSR